MKKQRGYLINGAHVLCSGKPDKETVSALVTMINLAKKMKAPKPKQNVKPR